MIETKNTELHEARVLAEYGEFGEEYVRAQFLSEGFEAIGLPRLSKWERRVAADGTVLDFDGRPMREKTRASLAKPMAPFERARQEFEDYSQEYILDQMQPGDILVEDSKHPNVPDKLAAEEGYHPDFRWLMKRVYTRTERSLILYNYPIPHGRGPEGINQHWGDRYTTIISVLREYDQRAEELTGIPHFLGEIWTGEERDYEQLELRRLEAEAEVEEYSSHYAQRLKLIGEALEANLLSEGEALELQRRYKRGFHTILLVKLNPERARLELTAEDYEWMEFLLEHEYELEEAFGGAYDVAERNGLIFIACGGMSSPESWGGQQEWYGASKTIGICVNCHLGPREVGEQGWCKPCITVHCN